MGRGRRSEERGDKTRQENSFSMSFNPQPCARGKDKSFGQPLTLILIPKHVRIRSHTAPQEVSRPSSGTFFNFKISVMGLHPLFFTLIDYSFISLPKTCVFARFCFDHSSPKNLLFNGFPPKTGFTQFRFHHSPPQN